MLVFANGNGGVDGDNNGNHYGEIKNGNNGHNGGDDSGGDGGSGGAAPSGLTGGAAPVDAAPEISMATINSAMALLVGGAMWLRHRK
jgi:hypothetical protein